MEPGNNDIKLKVCGMKFRENLEEVARLGPDFLGFIFYEKSPRYMAGNLSPEDLKPLPKKIKKVGVFVNASIQYVISNANDYGFDFVQLHGEEPIDYCKTVFEADVSIIKVFHVDKQIDWEQLKPYEDYVTYFLFDTKSKAYGGTGKAFDWQALNGYNLSTPYILSGGLDLANTADLNHLKVQPFAIDVNSKFESAPGLKEIGAVKKLKEMMMIKPMKN